MAKTFDLITLKQAEKLAENFYPGNDYFYNELSGLAGEVALRCAQCRDNYASMHYLYEALGNMQAMIQLYASVDEDAWEIVLKDKEAMGRIRNACENGETPSLVLKDSDWE